MDKTDLERLLEHGLPFHERWMGLAMSILGNRQDAEDVLQEVHLDLWKRSKKKEFEGSLNTLEFYIHRCVTNTCVTQIRKNVALTAKHDRVEYETVVEASGEQRAILNELAERLTPRQREAWDLVIVQGHTYREAGELMNANHKTVHELVTRAKSAMAKA